MAWVRIDDAMPDHPKIAGLGDMAPIAGWQFLCILAYCNRYLTDGHIACSKAHALVAWSHVGVDTATIGDYAAVGDDVDGDWACAILAKAGLLEDCPTHPDCYVVHDYLDYQPSREKVLQEREKAAERVRLHRNKQRNGVTSGVGNGASNGAPVPVPHPGPVGTSANALAPTSRAREDVPDLEVEAFGSRQVVSRGEVSDTDWPARIVAAYRDTHRGADPPIPVLAKWEAECHALEGSRPVGQIEAAMRGLMAEPNAGPGLLPYRVDRPDPAAAASREVPENPIDRRIREHMANSPWMQGADLNADLATIELPEFRA